MTVCGVGLSFL